MDTFRVGVTGIGYMGQLEARICASMGGFEVVGLHNRSREKAEALAEELSCSAHDSLEELVAVPELDALIIATPNNVHLEPVLQAAGRGLHIFLEKPMGLNVAECRRMSAAAEDAGVVLFMGHPQRFMDGLRRVRRIVAEGVIGRPVALRVERFFWVDSHHSAPSWKTQRETSGGHLFHHMHELDTARWILGEVETVYGQMANLAHPDAGDAGEDDVVQVSARYRQGTLGTFELGSAYRTRSHTLRLDGTEGTVLVDWASEGGTIALTTLDGATTYPMYDDPACLQSAAEVYAAINSGRVHGSDKWGAPLFLRAVVERELEAFHRLLSGESIEPDLLDLTTDAGLRSVELAQAACESSRERRVVQLPLP